VSFVPAKPATDNDENERNATPHTAVLLRTFRQKTGLKSGVILAEQALRTASYDGTTFDNLGITCRAHMRLGAELPFYEVAFKGNVYRLLARPIPGQDSKLRDDDVKYELARTWAPGLRVDGWFTDPPPVAVPNTPRALVEELLSVVGASLDDLLAQSYSIFHYRLDHQGRFPETMQPEGYTLRELFLGSVDAEGKLSTLYETPKGTNVELWTMFLRVLDRTTRAKLANYVSSNMAVNEFGEVGSAAMRQALTLRDGEVNAAFPMSGTRFIQAFPLSEFSSNLTREVGRHSGMF
jgi:hypothetical protein